MIKDIYRLPLLRTGQNLARIRQEKGYTQKGLAEISKVALSTIRRIESGQSNFRLSTIFTISRAMEINPGDFISD